MERLKSALADKILDISSGGDDQVKEKLDKIQRFRDFSNALKSLMVKYPAIEDELIEMVNHDDFDTKVAASRVDRIIRLTDTGELQPDTMASIVSDIVELPEEEPGNKSKNETAIDLIHEVKEDDENLFPSEEELAAARRKVNIKRIIQLVVIVLIVTILIIVVKFVMNHWQTILIIAGGVGVLALLLIWFFRRKRG